MSSPDIRDLWFPLYEPAAGHVIVDVGAGIGAATRVFSRAVGSTGRVVAIEPHPRAFSQLQATIEDERLHNVTAVRCAVSDHAGACALTDLHDFENNTLRIESEDCGTVPVEARTLDELMLDLDVHRIDFLKMNIEGAERLAIRAMDRTLAMTRSLAIACHDFVGELKNDPWFRTKALVTAYLISHGLAAHTREADPRVYVRDCLYARRDAGRAT